MVIDVTVQQQGRQRIEANLAATKLDAPKRRRRRRTKQEIEEQFEEPYYPTDGLIRKPHNYFSFVVAERPQYVPGSGPPLPRLSVTLAHDSTGFIIDKRHIYKKLYYIVGFTDYPELRISVHPPDILDYVSPRSLEDWESADYVRRVAEEEAVEPQKRLEEQQVDGSRAPAAVASNLKINGRKRKRTIHSKTATPSGGETPWKRGRPFKWSRFGPGRKSEPSPLPDLIFTSPKRPSQTSLSVPIKSLAEKELEDEDEDDEEDSEATDAQLDLQLIGANISSGTTTSTSSPLRRASHAEDTSSRDASAFFEKFEQKRAKPNSSHASPKFNPAKDPSPIVSPLIQNTSKASRAASDLPKPYVSSYDTALTPTSRSYNSPYPPLPPPDQSSSRPTSPRARTSTPPKYDLDESDKPATENISEGNAQAAEEEYDLEAILSDSLHISENGVETIVYEVKWVGDWHDTWEPASNIPPEAIREYEEKKREGIRNGKKKQVINISSDDRSDPDSPFVSDRPSKGKG